MVEVRDASEEELPIVLEIMLRAFEEYRGVLQPPSGALDETLDDVAAGAAEGGAVLAFAEGVPVGSARYAYAGDHVYCGRLATLPEHRGLGIAAMMLQHIHRVAAHEGYPEVRLSTREVMVDNLRLYLRLGYEIMGREPHPKGEGIVVQFRKQLETAP